MILPILAAMIASTGAQTLSPPPVAVTPTTGANAAEVTVPLSYRRQIKSGANGVTYDLTVFLPKHYDPRKTERYPVFYFVPGGIFGIYLSQIAHYLESGDIPDIIVVGIDFPPDDSYSLDLPTSGPDRHWTVPTNRGAANFLRILTNEIKPDIDREFPTKPDDTGIGGHSLGGFFALYALFNAPGTFGHVYASSPSFIWQDFRLAREEARLAATAQDLPARVYVDQGDLEGEDGRLETLTQAITGRSYPSLRWTARRVAGQTHQTIAFADGIDALYAIYGPRLRQADAGELANLAGRYRTSDGRTFSLQREGGHLYLAGLGDDYHRIELLSDRPSHWFVRYLWTTVDIGSRTPDGPTLAIRFADTPGPNGKAPPTVTARRIANGD